METTKPAEQHPVPAGARSPAATKPPVLGPQTVEEALERINKPEQPTPTQAEADKALSGHQGEMPAAGGVHQTR